MLCSSIRFMKLWLEKWHLEGASACNGPGCSAACRKCKVQGMCWVQASIQPYWLEKMWFH